MTRSLWLPSILMAVLVVVASAGATPHPVLAALAVSPVLECVIDHSPTSFVARFGYNNPNPGPVTLPIGAQNKFTPAPQDRGQPTVFQPGRQRNVFSVSFPGSNLVWTLNGRTSTASSTSKRCPYDITWVERSQPPYRVVNGTGSGAASGGLVYVVAGAIEVGGVITADRVLAYDPATDLWIEKAPVAIGRGGGHTTVTAPDGQIYAIGGEGPAGQLNAVEVYDPATNTWTPRAPMPTARSGLIATVGADGLIYVVGGNVGASGTILATNVLEVYDPATNTWTSKAPMPTARFSGTFAAASNGKLYAMGGNTGATGFGPTVAVVEEYEPLTDTWTTKAPMPGGRYGQFGIAASNGRIYITGGYQLPPGGGFSINSDVQEYTPATNSWRILPTPLPAVRGGAAQAYTSNGKIYLVGGDGGGFADNRVFEGTIVIP